MKTILSFVLAAIASLMFAAPTPVSAATVFYLTSAPSSWIGLGQTVYGTPATGYQIGFFEPGGQIGRSVINAHITGPQDTWRLDVSTPTLLALTPGTYANAQRYGFTTGNVPGLDFNGNGRGNQALSGSFTVHEIAFVGTTSKIERLALDVVQYDNRSLDNWNRVSIRFNSAVPISGIPEPGTVGLSLFAGSLMFRRRK